MKNRNYLWGLIFIFAAVFVLLNQAGFLDGLNLFTILVSLLLVAWLISSIPRMEFFGMLFPLAFLCILYSDYLNLDSITPWPVLAAALFGGIGLTIIFPKKYRNGTNFIPDYDSGDTIEHMTGPDVRSVVSFTGTTKYISSDCFEKGFFKCSFGSLKVFFDHVLIPTGKAEIVVDASFGEVQLYVPRNWHVINQVSVSFGDAKMDVRSDSSDGPVVVINGSVSFADCKIFYI
ncbi:MAG: LiaF transmembrane domain-containing protein [Lachnospiraceae bacterium]